MLNLTLKEICEMRLESNKKIEDFRSDLTTIGSKIGQLNQKKSEIEQNLKTQEKKSRAIRKALILVKGVPAKVSQARNQLLRKMERFRREDITVADSKNLKAEIETMALELEKACPHPFVYYQRGYEGSSYSERDDRYPDHRYCIVCGFLENGKTKDVYDFVGTSFEVLIETERRIIEDEPWTLKGRKRVNIWIPLGAVLRPFEEIVVEVLNS